MSDSGNLYDSIFTDDDDLDVGMLAINEMYGHLNFDEMSNYFSLESYNKTFRLDNHQALNLFHFNIRGLESNLVHFEALLSNMVKMPDIIALSETWLQKDDMDYFSLEGYNCFHVVRLYNHFFCYKTFVMQQIYRE